MRGQSGPDVAWRPHGIIQTVLGRVIAQYISWNVNEGEIMIPKCPLKAQRAAEMLLHAYNYVRGLDPDGETGAADLLWAKYKELNGRLTIRKSRTWVVTAFLAAGLTLQLPLTWAAQEPEK